MHDVFGIFELAELIFLECKIQDLLVHCQRVCRQWRNIITSSHRLQQALFFEPLPGYRIVRYDNNEPGQPESIFIDRHLPGWQYGDPLSQESRRRLADDERTLVFANPFLDLVFRKSLKICAPFSYVANAVADYDERRRYVSAAKPSWWRMLACQPPLYELNFASLVTEEDYQDETIDDATGVTIFDTIWGDSGHQTTPRGFDAMVPVTFAKDVVRTNYKKGDYEFKECVLDLW